MSGSVIIDKCANIPHFAAMWTFELRLLCEMSLSSNHVVVRFVPLVGFGSHTVSLISSLSRRTDVLLLSTSTGRSSRWCMSADFGLMVFSYTFAVSHVARGRALQQLLGAARSHPRKLDRRIAEAITYCSHE